MKKFKKTLSLVLGTCMMIATVMPMHAVASYQTVVGSEDPGINICLNDLNIVNRDANGNAVFPVIINGSTYLPVRGVAAAAGLTVGWDPTSQTVRLVTNPDVNMVEATKAFTEPKIDPNSVKYISVSEAENNDDFFQPQVLPALPVQIEGVISDKDGSSTDSKDYYQFEVTGEGQVRIDISSHIETNATFNFYGYNKNNSAIGYSYSDNWTERTVTTYLTKGTYIVKVDSAAQGTYTLKIAELPLINQVGDNSDFIKAHPMTLGTKLYNYSRTKDTYNVTQSTDYYSFEIKATQAVMINTVSKDTTNVSLKLYSEAKTNDSIAIDSSDTKTNRFISRVLQPGKYILSVTSDKAGYYGILVEGITATVLSSKQITATIRPDINIVINGTPFTAKDAGGNVIYPVIINGSTYLPVRAVAQAVGLSIGWDGSVRTVIMAKNPTENLLQIVGNKFQDQGAISEIEDNDAFYSAQKISLVGSVNGIISDKQNNKADSKDYYQIEVPYEGQLTVNLVGDVDVTDIHLRVSGYNDKNSSIIYDNAGDSNIRMVAPFLKAGSYIILVDGVKDSGKYTLSTTFSCPSTQGEENDRFDIATVIDLNSEIDGIIKSNTTINAKESTDYYKLIVFDTGTLNIKITADRQVNATVKLFSALRPNAPIAFNNAAIEAERNLIQAVQPGVYYIEINNAGDDGLYHLSTSLTK